MSGFPNICEAVYHFVPHEIIDILGASWGHLGREPRTVLILISIFRRPFLSVFNQSSAYPLLYFAALVYQLSGYFLLLIVETPEPKDIVTLRSEMLWKEFHLSHGIAPGVFSLTETGVKCNLCIKEFGSVEGARSHHIRGGFHRYHYYRYLQNHFPGNGLLP